MSAATVYAVHHRDGYTCGHRHRTPEAAERCHRSLLDSRCCVCGRKVCRRRTCGGLRTHAARWHSASLWAIDAGADEWRPLSNDEAYRAASADRPGGLR